MVLVKETRKLQRNPTQWKRVYSQTGSVLVPEDKTSSGEGKKGTFHHEVVNLKMLNYFSKSNQKLKLLKIHQSVS